MKGYAANATCHDPGLQMKSVARTAHHWSQQSQCSQPRQHGARTPSSSAPSRRAVRAQSSALFRTASDYQLRARSTSPRSAHNVIGSSSPGGRGHSTPARESLASIEIERRKEDRCSENRSCAAPEPCANRASDATAGADEPRSDRRAPPCHAIGPRDPCDSRRTSIRRARLLARCPRGRLVGCRR
jgi:hypothetical protein